MARITIAQLQARIAEQQQWLATAHDTIIQLKAEIEQLRTQPARTNGVVIERYGQRVVKRFAPRSTA